MGHSVTNGLAMVLLALDLLVSLPAQSGGGWSKAASYFHPPQVDRLSNRVHSTRSDPVLSDEPVNIPSASSIVNHRGQGSLNITALPTELVVNILANLSIRDLLVCQHVCKNWQSLVTTMPTLACAAYRSCHPAGYVPRLNDAISSYRGSTRQWLNGFSEQGRKAVTRLDGLLRSGESHFPEQLFFAIARVLEEAPAFDCCKVYTIKHPESVPMANFSPDEQYVLSYAGDAVSICRLVDGRWQDMDTLRQTGQVISAYFSPDSKYLVARLANGNATIWALVDGQWQQQTDWNPVFIRLFPQFNADTTYLVTALVNDSVQIYRLIDGQWRPQVTALKYHSAQGVHFHPKQPDLLATHYHNTVTLWRSVDGRWLQDGTLPHPHRISSISFSPDGDRLMVHSIGTDQSEFAAKVNIHIWHRVGREWRQEAVLLPTNAGYTASFSPCGNYILAPNGQYQSGMGLWRLSRGQWQNIKTKNIFSGNFSPDQGYLIIQGWTDYAVICRWIDGLFSSEAVLAHHTLSGYTKFSPHGNHLLATTYIDTAAIWGIVNGRWQVKATLPHAFRLYTIGFSPQGSYVLTTTLDGTVTVWSLSRQQ